MNDEPVYGERCHAIAGYFVQDNGMVRSCLGEYIGKLSDLEECEARGKEIASLNGQVAMLKAQIKAIPTYEKAHELEGVVTSLKKQLEEREELLEKFREAFKFYDPYNHRGNRERWESLSSEALALLSKSLNKEVKE